MKPLSLSRWLFVIVISLGLTTRSQTLFGQASAALSVTLTQPTNGAVLSGSVQLEAITTDYPDDVAYVSFLARPAGIGVLPQYVLLVGTTVNGVPLNPPQLGRRLFTFTWTNAPVGTWSLTASATTTNGASANSTAVQIRVIGSVPAVAITTPTNGAVYVKPSNIEIVADVAASGDLIASVSFFDGSQLLGVVSNRVVIDPLEHNPPVQIAGAYIFNWLAPSFGNHSLTAAVTDTNGNSTTSAPVSISVVSNLPPTVRITSPPNYAVFRAPVNIPLLAYAANPNGSVTSVQFYAGSNSLGFGKPLSPSVIQPLAPGLPSFLAPPTNMFELIWSNAPVGSNTITAVVTDSDGLSATSLPVNLLVEAAPPPSIRLPGVVTIVATDPIAIEGTNCWPWLAGPVNWSNWTSPVAVFAWQTNCGPQDASFTVRRSCDVSNSDLTVNYSISGTASNGLDYALLPGSVTIPAGQDTATITIVPIDGSSNLSSTVTLQLLPLTNASPVYVLGYPQRAEALIIDGNGPRPVPPGVTLPDRSFHLIANGPDGAWFHIDYTTDLLNWTTLCTNQVINGAIDFLDPDAALSTTRIYRAVPIAGTP